MTQVVEPFAVKTHFSDYFSSDWTPVTGVQTESDLRVGQNSVSGLQVEDNAPIVTG